MTKLIEAETERNDPGYMDRRPFIYLPKRDLLVVGQPGTHHQDVMDHQGIPWYSKEPIGYGAINLNNGVHSHWAGERWPDRAKAQLDQFIQENHPELSAHEPQADDWSFGDQKFAYEDGDSAQHDDPMAGPSIHAPAPICERCGVPVAPSKTNLCNKCLGVAGPFGRGTQTDSIQFGNDTAYLAAQNMYPGGSLPWEPGQAGRGLVGPNGEFHAWTADYDYIDQHPEQFDDLDLDEWHHGDMAEWLSRRGHDWAHPFNLDQNTSCIYIDPDMHTVGNFNDAQRAALKARGIDPRESQWNKFGAYDESHHNWEPGTYGKGFILNDGTPVTWSLYDPQVDSDLSHKVYQPQYYGPHHAEIATNMGLQDEPNSLMDDFSGWHTPVYIKPNGEVSSLSYWPGAEHDEEMHPFTQVGLTPIPHDTGWKFASEGFGTAAPWSNINDHKYEHGDFEHSYHTWQPGQTGKGMILPDGRPITWNIHGGGNIPAFAGPHHAEVAEHLGLSRWPDQSDKSLEEDARAMRENGFDPDEDAVDPSWHSPIYIDENGNYDTVERYWNSHQWKVDPGNVFEQLGLKKNEQPEGFKFASDDAARYVFDALVNQQMGQPLQFGQVVVIRRGMDDKWSVIAPGGTTKHNTINGTINAILRPKFAAAEGSMPVVHDQSMPWHKGMHGKALWDKNNNTIHIWGTGDSDDGRPYHSDYMAEEYGDTGKKTVNYEPYVIAPDGRVTNLRHMRPGEDHRQAIADAIGGSVDSTGWYFGKSEQQWLSPDHTNRYFTWENGEEVGPFPHPGPYERGQEGKGYIRGDKLYLWPTNRSGQPHHEDLMDHNLEYPDSLVYIDRDGTYEIVTSDEYRDNARAVLQAHGFKPGDPRFSKRATHELPAPPVIKGTQEPWPNMPFIDLDGVRYHPEYEWDDDLDMPVGYHAQVADHHGLNNLTGATFGRYWGKELFPMYVAGPHGVGQFENVEERVNQEPRIWNEFGPSDWKFANDAPVEKYEKTSGGNDDRSKDANKVDQMHLSISHRSTMDEQGASSMGEGTEDASGESYELRKAARDNHQGWFDKGDSEIAGWGLRVSGGEEEYPLNVKGLQTSWGKMPFIDLNGVRYHPAHNMTDMEGYDRPHFHAEVAEHHGLTDKDLYGASFGRYRSDGTTYYVSTPDGDDMDNTGSRMEYEEDIWDDIYPEWRFASTWSAPSQGTYEKWTQDGPVTQPVIPYDGSYNGKGYIKDGRLVLWAINGAGYPHHPHITECRDPDAYVYVDKMADGSKRTIIQPRGGDSKNTYSDIMEKHGLPRDMSEDNDKFASSHPLPQTRVQPRTPNAHFIPQTSTITPTIDPSRPDPSSGAYAQELLSAVSNASWPLSGLDGDSGGVPPMNKIEGEKPIIDVTPDDYDYDEEGPRIRKGLTSPDGNRYEWDTQDGWPNHYMMAQLLAQDGEDLTPWFNDTWYRDRDGTQHRTRGKFAALASQGTDVNNTVRPLRNSLPFRKHDNPSRYREAKNGGFYHNWEPGEHGKYIVTPGGELHHWNTDRDGSPHHMDYVVQNIMTDPNDILAATEGGGLRDTSPYVSEFGYIDSAGAASDGSGKTKFHKQLIDSGLTPSSEPYSFEDEESWKTSNRGPATSDGKGWSFSAGAGWDFERHFNDNPELDKHYERPQAWSKGNYGKGIFLADGTPVVWNVDGSGAPCHSEPGTPGYGNARHELEDGSWTSAFHVDEEGNAALYKPWNREPHHDENLAELGIRVNEDLPYGFKFAENAGVNVVQKPFDPNKTDVHPELIDRIPYIHDPSTQTVYVGHPGYHHTGVMSTGAWGGGKSFGYVYPPGNEHPQGQHYWYEHSSSQRPSNANDIEQAVNDFLGINAQGSGIGGDRFASESQGSPASQGGQAGQAPIQKYPVKEIPIEPYDDSTHWPYLHLADGTILIGPQGTHHPDVIDYNQANIKQPVDHEGYVMPNGASLYYHSYGGKLDARPSLEDYFGREFKTDDDNWTFAKTAGEPERSSARNGGQGYVSEYEDGDSVAPAWERGVWGKGILHPNGHVDIWQPDMEGEPHHAQVYEGNDGLEFGIDPDGYLDVYPSIDDWKNRELHQKIVDSHPELKINENHWLFGSVKSGISDKKLQADLTNTYTGMYTKMLDTAYANGDDPYAVPHKAHEWPEVMDRVNRQYGGPGWTQADDNAFHQNYQQQKLRQHLADPDAYSFEHENWADWYAKHFPQHFDPKGHAIHSSWRFSFAPGQIHGLDPWKPGEQGKGFASPDGRAYIWPIQGGYDGYPSHEDALKYLNENFNDAANGGWSFYAIHPDGSYTRMMGPDNPAIDSILPQSPHCPGCGAPAEVDHNNEFACPGCRWQGDAYTGKRDEWRFAKTAAVTQLDTRGGDPSWQRRPVVADGGNLWIGSPGSYHDDVMQEYYYGDEKGPKMTGGHTDHGMYWTAEDDFAPGRIRWYGNNVDPAHKKALEDHVRSEGLEPSYEDDMHFGSSDWNIIQGTRDADSTIWDEGDGPPSTPFDHWPYIANPDTKTIHIGNPGSHHADLQDEFKADGHHGLVYPWKGELNTRLYTPDYLDPQDRKTIHQVLERHFGQPINNEDDGWKFAEARFVGDRGQELGYKGIEINDTGERHIWPVDETGYPHHGDIASEEGIANPWDENGEFNPAWADHITFLHFDKDGNEFHPDGHFAGFFEGASPQVVPHDSEDYPTREIENPEDWQSLAMVYEPDIDTVHIGQHDDVHHADILENLDWPEEHIKGALFREENGPKYQWYGYVSPEQEKTVAGHLKNHFGETFTNTQEWNKFASEAPQIVPHDTPKMDSGDSQSAWWSGRIPIVYDHNNNVIHYGSPDSTHGDVMKAAGIPAYDHKWEYSHGWVGANPESWRGGEGSHKNFGWYTNIGSGPTPPIHVQQAVLDHFGAGDWDFDKHHDFSDWRFAADRENEFYQWKGTLGDRIPVCHWANEHKTIIGQRGQHHDDLFDINQSYPYTGEYYPDERMFRWQGHIEAGGNEPPTHNEVMDELRKHFGHDITYQPTKKEDWFFSKTASKIDWLQERPDKFKDTPVGQDALNGLVTLTLVDPKIDPLTPWLWREAKKRRIKISPQGNIVNLESPFGSFGRPNASHWGDWFGSNSPTRRGVDLMSMRFNDFIGKIKDWDEELAAKNQESNMTNGRVIFKLPNNWTIRELEPEDLDYEGDNMGHCVGGEAYKQHVRNGDGRIISLRDEENKPHATMELHVQHNREALGRPDLYVIEQVQGKGNEQPKPEYQAMIKQWIDSLPQDQKPVWKDPSEEINTIGEVMGEGGHDPYGWGGYEPHGDYGVPVPYRDTDYDHILNNLHQNDYNRSRGYGSYDPAHGEALYEHALSRKEIPQLARAYQSYQEEALNTMSDAEEQNWEFLNYPGEYEDDPDRWESEAQWEDAMEDYNYNRQELADSIPQYQAAGHIGDLLSGHWNPETNQFENEKPKPQTFSNWKFAVHLQEWEPGSDGKGYIDPYGEPLIWKVDGVGYPHHFQVFNDRDEDPYAMIQIRPDGNIIAADPDEFEEVRDDYLNYHPDLKRDPHPLNFS